VADLDDPALQDRVAGLKATRDQAQADALRAQAMLESAPIRPSRRRCSASSPTRPGSECGPMGAATAATTSGYSPSGAPSRSLITKPASISRRTTISAASRGYAIGAGV
jgi:hypothetical protein